MFTRESLAELFNELGYKTGAEIGVKRGHYAKILCDAVPGLKYYGVDNWRLRDNYYEYAKNYLAGYDATLIRKDSVEAAKDFAPGSLDFVYIDASHFFDDVMMDLILWVPKVKSGGIISGHDFVKTDRVGIIEATTAYANAHGIRDWYLTTRGGEGKTPSWFWVKP